MGKYKNDTTAFLMSFDLQMQFPVNKTEKAIYCYSEYGPNFGGSSLAAIQQFNGSNQSMSDSFSNTNYMIADYTGKSLLS